MIKFCTTNENFRYLRVCVCVCVSVNLSQSVFRVCVHSHLSIYLSIYLNLLTSIHIFISIYLYTSIFFRDYGWDFMSIRVWIGLWTFVILMIIVAFDLCMLIRYVTRFTEETFACLIAFIFIFEAHQKMFEINTNYPINRYGRQTFICMPATSRSKDDLQLLQREELNETNGNTSGEGASQGSVATSVVSVSSESRLFPLTEPTALLKESAGELVAANSTSLLQLNGTWDNQAITDCSHCAEENPYVPDVLLLSVLLFLGTYIVARGMERFRTSGFFPHIVSPIDI